MLYMLLIRFLTLPNSAVGIFMTVDCIFSQYKKNRHASMENTKAELSPSDSKCTISQLGKCKRRIELWE